MPPLPRKNDRREAKLDGKVAEWLRKNHPCKNWLLEVKMKRGKHLPHQKAAAQQVIAGKFLWKPSDMGSRMPGDYIRLGDADAIYCVINGKDVRCEVNDGVITYNFKI
jgi:hypothetical protein